MKPPLLLMYLRVPGADGDLDPEAVARELASIVNEERDRNGGPRGSVEVDYAAWTDYRAEP